MFKRKNTVQLEITYKELQMLRRYLLIWRNKLLAQGNNEIIERIRQNIAKVIVGKENVIDYYLTALLAQGHITDSVDELLIKLG